MAKKPQLSLVNSATIASAPPRKLGQHGLALWNAINSEFVVDDRGGIELLAQLCAAQDRVEALAERINDDGETIRTKNGLKAHPALRDELALRAFICRTLQRLGVTVEIVKPIGRPSGS